MEKAGYTERLTNDIRLSAVAMAVGAMDAYFCDAYVDCLTSVLRAYANGNWEESWPKRYLKRELPAGKVLDSLREDASRSDRPFWALRMVSREAMERDNMLSISRINSEFNPILPDSQKLWQRFVDKLIAYDYKRFTGIYSNELEELSGPELGKARKDAVQTFKERVGDTVQIRNDWIHNCGRPKVAIKDLTDQQALERIREINILVTEFDDHIQEHRLVR
jgi:hypothetical protein